MRPVPRTAAVAFTASAALVIALAAPLALFNPWLTSALQARHDVPASVGAPAEAVTRLTSGYLADIWLGGTFDAALDGGEPYLDERERSHMRDVSSLVRLLGAVLAVSLVVALLGALAVADRARVGRLLVVASASIGAVAVVLAVVFAVAFEPAFLAFHAIFFPPDSYLFAADSDLIALFPGGFWFDAALLAGGGIVLSAVVAALLGLGLARAARG